MKITFLGTSSMLPTKNRNTSSTLINFKNENILIDCGEGTQRQMRIAGISPTKITKILITHWHGDHVLGIPGLLQTLYSSEYSKKLEIYGPKNTKKYINELLKLFPIKKTGEIELTITEVGNTKKIYENYDFYISSKELKHTAPVVGYSITEKDKRKINTQYTKKFGLTKDPILKKLVDGKTITFEGKKITPEKGTILKKGKKISLITDTSYFKEISTFVKNSDILICESTFEKELKAKAKEFGHLTAEEAAKIAKNAKVKKLFLIHFGQRYKNEKVLEKEAKKTFPDTKAAKDFLEVKL